MKFGDSCETLQMPEFRRLRCYHFCFVRVTGRVGRNSRPSQSETFSTSETVGRSTSAALQLRLGGRQFPSSYGVGEPTSLMRTVTKRLVCRVSATAEADDGTPRKAEGLSLGINNLEVPFDPDGPVVIDCYFRGRHFSLEEHRVCPYSRATTSTKAPTPPSFFCMNVKRKGLQKIIS